MKILIVKTSSLGDIVQSFPVLDYLRKKFPEAQIDWLVDASCAELLRANKQVSRVITFDKKNWRKEVFKQFFELKKQLKQTRYDLLFDLQGNIKSGFLTMMARAKVKVGFGFKTVREWPNVFFTTARINPPKGKNIREDYLGVVQGYFKDEKPHIFHPELLHLEPLQQQKLHELFNEGQKPTLVCPFSRWSNKCLSEKDLVSVLQELDAGPYWIIWGSQKERESALKISQHLPKSVVLERLSLAVLQHVMARSKLVISMDSLALHLCATTSTPVLSFFGPSLAAKFAPQGQNSCSIQGKCPYEVRFEKTCPKLRSCGTGSCLKSITITESELGAIMAKVTNLQTHVCGKF